MKQLAFTTALLLLLTACKGISQMANQEITVKNASADLVLEKNSPLVALEIDGKPTYFLFDTGATATALTDSSAVPGFTDKKFGHIGSVAGADGKKKKNRILVCSVKSPVFESLNKALIYIEMPKAFCQSAVKSSYSGILGMDVFFKDELSLQLDFTNSKIANLTKAQVDSITAAADYFQVKSECESKSKIFIFLTIEGKELRFKLDTGFGGNMIIPSATGVAFASTDKIELEGSLYRTVTSQTQGKEIFYENLPVTVGSETVTSEVSVSGSVTAQNIGINFMKGFDWIIDSENNRVFLRRNQNAIGRMLPEKLAYYSRENNGKLLIVVKEQSLPYLIGDEIVSVNGTPVTPDNVCEMQNLVNKTADWSRLVLEVGHPAD